MTGTSDPKGAEEIAEQNHGETLEMKLDENNIEMPEYMNSDGSVSKESSTAWKEESEVFAQNASGNVHCIQGDKVNEKSTYNTVEHPELIENENISSISVVNAENGEETENVETFDHEQTNGAENSTRMQNPPTHRQIQKTQRRSMKVLKELP